MRLWDTVHPSLLCRKHLLGEHNELHAIYSTVSGISRGWAHHPEVKRFLEHGDGLMLLFMRHELLRVEMNARWEGNHTCISHPSPIVRPDGRQHAFELWYIRYYRIVEIDEFETNAAAVYPASGLEQITPWDRDRMTRDDYIRLGDDWSIAYKEGARPAQDPYQIGVL